MKKKVIILIGCIFLIIGILILVDYLRHEYGCCSYCNDTVCPSVCEKCKGILFR